MNQFVVITGPDGAGKSTVIERLRQRLPDFYFASIWDPLNHSQGLTKENVQTYLQEIEPRSRSYFFLHALQESLAKAKKSGRPVLFDSYSYKYYISQTLMGDPHGALLLLELPTPDSVFYLRCRPEVAFQRKGALGLSAYEAGFSSDQPTQFLKLQTEASHLWQKLFQNNKHWTAVDESLPLEEKIEFIYEQL